MPLIHWRQACIITAMSRPYVDLKVRNPFPSNFRRQFKNYSGLWILFLRWPNTDRSYPQDQYKKAFSRRPWRGGGRCPHVGRESGDSQVNKFEYCGEGGGGGEGSILAMASQVAVAVTRESSLQETYRHD